MSPGAAAEHITPYDRLAMDEATMVALLASRTQNEALVEYFGAGLHAELVKLARVTLLRPAAQRRPAAARRRVYVLPGIMGSQLGFTRGGARPNDILWLDPIDISFGRLTELRFAAATNVVALGAMNYTYLKLTLSLRKAGFDAVLLDYDWRRDIATLGNSLAERLAADGQDEVAIVGHSMGGLVARAALRHAAGKRVSQVVTLGTPHSGSLAATQALRGTYSVVRKLGMLDLRHDAEYLAAGVFSSFPSLYEMLPSGNKVCDFDLFDAATWPPGPGPDAALLRAAAGVTDRLAPADPRFTVVVGCNRTTATRVALRGGDFEYEYSLRGDGTVPMALALLAGANHRYVECGHSDMPLSDRVIAGTIDLLKTGKTRRFRASPTASGGARRTHVSDAELRREYRGKVDWPHMSPGERRVFLDTLNEPPRRTRPGLKRKRPTRAARSTRPRRKR